MDPDLGGATHFLGQLKLREILLGPVKGGGVQAKLGRLLCKVMRREFHMKVIGRRPWASRKVGLLRLPLLVGMLFLMLVEFFDIIIAPGGLEFTLRLRRR